MAAEPQPQACAELVSLSLKITPVIKAPQDLRVGLIRMPNSLNTLWRRRVLDTTLQRTVRYLSALGLLLLALAPTQIRAQSQHVTAKAQAMGCFGQEDKAGCKMYMAGFVDTIRFVMAKGESNHILCADVDSTELVAEFEYEARKKPNTDANALLFQILKENHTCAASNVASYEIVPAGKLNDLCHTGSTGFQLCSYYERGFLNALFYLSEQTKIPVLCGDLRLVGNSLSIMSEALDTSFPLRKESAASVMFMTLQQKLPCPK